MQPHILQIAYDDGLLRTRALMLEKSGYVVTSVLGNEKARDLSPAVFEMIDVIVIGFSTTHAGRSEMLHWLKQNCPAIPVVVLQSHSFEKFPGADGVTLSESPATWLSAVSHCLEDR